MEDGDEAGNLSGKFATTCPPLNPPVPGEETAHACAIADFNRYHVDLACAGIRGLQMRPLQALICVVIVSVGSASVAQQSNAEPPPAKQESAQKSPCKSPNPTFTPDPLPPASWEGKGPKTAVTIFDLLVDRKGKVHDPVVIQSGGDDVDKQALDSVRRWRFTPATCGTDPIEAKVRVRVTTSLR